MKVLFIINFTPKWARPADCQASEMCAPATAETIAAYGAFAGAAAEHYAPLGIHSYEIWNEPNLSYRFRPASRPAHYVQMLKAAYRNIIKADPTADILAGNTAPSASDALSFTPLDFTQQMYDLGAQGYFTAMAAHPYTYPKTPNTAGPLDAWGQLVPMHDLMIKHGDSEKLIWLTEFGAPTHGRGHHANDDYVSEAVQAQILNEAAVAVRDWGWLGPLMWYDYADSGFKSNSSENFYGLVRDDGSRKPAYDSFIRASEELNQ
jgi:hypothetical protein